MTSVITLKQVRNQLSDIVSRVAFGEQKVVITRFGKPVAAIVTYADYEKIMDPRKRFTRAEWEKPFKLMEKIRKNTAQYPPEEVQAAIDEAVKEVRAKKHVQSNA